MYSITIKEESCGEFHQTHRRSSATAPPASTWIGRPFRASIRELYHFNVLCPVHFELRSRRPVKAGWDSQWAAK